MLLIFVHCEAAMHFQMCHALAVCLCAVGEHAFYRLIASLLVSDAMICCPFCAMHTHASCCLIIERKYNCYQYFLLCNRLPLLPSHHTPVLSRILAWRVGTPSNCSNGFVLVKRNIAHSASNM